MGPTPSHSGPNMRLTVDPPEHIERWAAIGIMQVRFLGRDDPLEEGMAEPTQTHVHRVGDAIQPFHPLSSPSSPALNLSQHRGLCCAGFSLVAVSDGCSLAVARRLLLAV